MSTFTVEQPELVLPTVDRLNVKLPDNVDAKLIAAHWFKQFAQSMEAGDAIAVVDLLLCDAFWRDMLALTWEFRTFHGASRISRFLSDIFATSSIASDKEVSVTNFVLDDNQVELKSPYPDLAWIQGTFSFETNIGHGSGVFRLVPISSEKWKAHVVYTNLESLKGFPEHVGSLRNMEKTYGDEWLEQRKRESNFETSDPTVVIVGAGQAGLEVAARLKYMGVSTLILECNNRVGDSWRKRYEALCLHDPIYAIHMAYHPFPQTWPLWTPAPKFADWLESYAQILELNIWTGANIERIEQGTEQDEHPWTVHVIQSDGHARVLKSRHIIFAHGLFGGPPKIPNIPGMDEFKGKMIHSTRYRSAKEHDGQKVVVIGACTSGHDICLDHAKRDIDITMVQRGSTYIMSLIPGIVKFNKGAYWEGSPPADVSDRIGGSYPHFLTKLMHQRLAKEIADLDKDTLDGLRQKGFKLNMGEDNSGVHMLFVRRGGGFYFDTGASQMIIDGKVKLKSNSAIAKFTSDGIKFEDGSFLPADVIILATGYGDPREVVRKLAGDKVADALGPIWGLNEEGEINNVWRWSGVPRLYFMMGNLQLCRFHSKHLALQIKAQEEGLYGRRYTA